MNDTFIQPSEQPAAAMAGAAGARGWPGSQVDLVPIDNLVPAARNARTHSHRQISVIADLMLSYGFTNPVLCDEAGEIIAGHGRVLAAAVMPTRCAAMCSGSRPSSA